MAKTAPYVVGVAEDGSSAKLWTFEAGDVEITAEIVPADEESEKQIVKECGVALDEAAGQVCCSSLLLHLVHLILLHRFRQSQHPRFYRST